MTEEKSFADRARDPATDDDSPHAHQAPERRSWAAAIMHRWPTWLAIALAALTAGGSTVESLAGVLPMLAFAYLAAAVLQRRQATWLVAIATVAAFAALRLQGWVDPVVALLVAALAFVLWGAVRGQLRRRGALVVETAGMVGFTAIALAAVSVDLDIGRYIVAAGWFGHAAWDFAHYRADKVVSRSFAEWCAVFDFLRAAAILVLPML
ncbi:MAG: hypothetical protein LC781_07430 [Actinobacteria bacterium]|nr:hypothetical protein [Actinomycetota bacterium]